MSKPIPTGSQLLTLPIQKMGVTAGYKNQKYLAQFGFGHYGIDAVSETGDRTVYALGAGQVLAAGLDGAAGDYSGLGWITVIRYNQVYIPATGKVLDLIATTFHHEAGSVRVKAGDRVTAQTVIARYGNTGGTTLPGGGRMGAHLHLQLDADTDYPLYCSGISGKGSRLLKRGTTDSTMNPWQVLVAGARQYAYTRDDGWAEDWTEIPERADFQGTGEAPEAPEGWVAPEVYRAAVERVEALEGKIQRARAALA